MTDRQKICRALCKSGKFETGEGTCAPLCLSQLGDARRDCCHRETIHGKLADRILSELEDA